MFIIMIAYYPCAVKGFITMNYLLNRGNIGFEERDLINDSAIALGTTLIPMPSGELRARTTSSLATKFTLYSMPNPSCHWMLR